MTFELTKHIINEDVRWVWKLTAADGPVAHSAGTFPDEPAARADVARAKKKMNGAKFAKVVGP